MLNQEHMQSFRVQQEIFISVNVKNIFLPLVSVLVNYKNPGSKSHETRVVYRTESWHECVVKIWGTHTHIIKHTLLSVITSYNAQRSQCAWWIMAWHHYLAEKWLMVYELHKHWNWETSSPRASLTLTHTSGINTHHEIWAALKTYCSPSDRRSRIHSPFVQER